MAVAVGERIQDFIYLSGLDVYFVAISDDVVKSL